MDPNGKVRIFTLFFFLALITFLTFELYAQREKQGIRFPLGIDPDALNVPEDNPITPEKVELGKMLYFDKRLSANGTVSCTTCHDPRKGFTDQLPVSQGMNQLTGTRNAPTVINSAFNLFHFWDGRAPSLEEQAKGPIGNPVEMAHTLEGAVKNVGEIEGYRPYFKAAFGTDEVTGDRIVQSIATFERTVLSGNSPWDRYVYNKDESALSDSAKRGLVLFEGKARCTQCHVGFNLSDGIFHNIGIGMDQPNPDLGRYVVTQEEKDKGAFKTPMLRDLLRTGPYMHDGSEKTLEEVVEYYDRGGNPNPWLDSKMQLLKLTDQEQGDLVEFLKSLEGDWKPVEEPQLPQ